jgi:ABC-type multidrug transport system ATPase subunit
VFAFAVCNPQASLRLPSSTTPAALELAVHRVLDALALTHIADSRIGTPDSGGISGGERKRVQLAQELVCDPALVLCDEPTSGLDSNNAELVVKVWAGTHFTLLFRFFFLTLFLVA